MGVKKMLAQGIANEQKMLQKASNIKDTTNNSIEEKLIKNIAPEEEPKTIPEPTLQEKKIETLTELKKDIKTNKRKKVGRPKNSEKGLPVKKQYSITLSEESFSIFYEEAERRGISFAKLIENATFEYISNHR